MKGNDVKLVLIGAAAALAAGCQPSREETVAAHQQTISHYCLDCHNYAEQVADLSLEPVKLDGVAADPEKWEKVVRKLRAGMMPPSGNPRPEHETYKTLASWIESELDRDPKEILPPPGLAPHEPRRVRQCDSRSARARHRFRHVPAGRRLEPRLRQSSRHAGLVPGAARGVPERREQDQPARPRRRRGSEPIDVPGRDRRDAELSRRGPAVRYARRPRVRARVPGRRRVQHQGVFGEPRQHGQLSPVRRGARREARGSRRRRARAADRLGRGVPVEPRRLRRRQRPAQDDRRARAGRARGRTTSASRSSRRTMRRVST